MNKKKLSPFILCKNFLLEFQLLFYKIIIEQQIVPDYKNILDVCQTIKDNYEKSKKHLFNYEWLNFFKLANLNAKEAIEKKKTIYIRII